MSDYATNCPILDKHGYHWLTYYPGNEDKLICVNECTFSECVVVDRVGMIPSTVRPRLVFREYREKSLPRELAGMRPTSCKTGRP